MSKRKGALWLDPTLWEAPFRFCLFTDPSEYAAFVEQEKIQNAPPYLNPGANATTIWIERNNAEITAIVNLPATASTDPIQVCALLVHEAVHLWQHCRDVYGEKSPGSESEAYAIQALSQRLMYEYRRQVYGTDS